MPATYIGFMLKPTGFFDRNPAINLAPDAVKHSQRLEVDGRLTGELDGSLQLATNGSSGSCCGK